MERVQLLEVGGDDHRVHAARAKVRDEQQPEHRLPGHRRQLPGPFGSVGERHFGHVRVAHGRHFRPPVERMSAFHLHKHIIQRRYSINDIVYVYNMYMSSSCQKRYKDTRPSSWRIDDGHTEHVEKRQLFVVSDVKKKKIFK